MVFVQVALDRLDSRGSKVADYLLVIDMQSDYVAVGKAYHEELIVAVNDKIASSTQRSRIHHPTKSYL